MIKAMEQMKRLQEAGKKSAQLDVGTMNKIFAKLKQRGFKFSVGVDKRGVFFKEIRKVS